MGKAEELLYRLSEVMSNKISFEDSPSKLKLQSSKASLKKTSNLKSQVLQKTSEPEQQGPAVGHEQDNALRIEVGLAKMQGHPVIYFEVTKEKPFKKLVIARNAIRTVAEAMAKMAVTASIAAEKQGGIVAILVVSKFSSGKETRRFRACLNQFGQFIGARIYDRMESDGEQAYMLGP